MMPLINFQSSIRFDFYTRIVINCCLACVLFYHYISEVSYLSYTCALQKLADLSATPSSRLIDGILLTKFDTIDDKVDTHQTSRSSKILCLIILSSPRVTSDV